MLEDVARQRINELRSSGHQLVQAIDQLLDQPEKPHGDNRAQKLAVNRGTEKRRHRSGQN
jgi:hypothetical protein